MSSLNSARATDVEGQLILGEELILPAFGTDLRNIGYCNLIYTFHDMPDRCHIKVRLDPATGTLWITPYNPLDQNQRFEAFSDHGRVPYFLKKVIVSKTSWQAWKASYKTLERSCPRIMPDSQVEMAGNMQGYDTKNNQKPAKTTEDCLPIAESIITSTEGNEGINKSAFITDEQTSNTNAGSDEEEFTPEGTPTPSEAELQFLDLVALINWPTIQSIRSDEAGLAARSHPKRNMYGSIKLPHCLRGISGNEPDALKRDPLVTGLIKKEYLEGRTVYIGDDIHVCTRQLTQQLQRIDYRRTMVRMLLLERECYRDAMTEETINAIARGEVNAAKGDDPLRAYQLDVRKLFLDHVREFSLDAVKRLAFSAGETDIVLAEGYAFYVISPDAGVLTQYLEFVE